MLDSSTMGAYRLRLLHISDLHERGSRDVEPWRKRRLFGEAWQHNLTELIQDGPFDLICFTGDAADWGLPEEYTAATEFFSALCDELRVARERLFLVPGNHDVYRKTGEEEWKKLRVSVGAGADGLQVSQWINGLGKPPLGVEDGWRAPVLARQDDWRTWVQEQLERPEQVGDPLGYRVTLTLPAMPFPVHVIGLNTAWLCGDDADPTRLLLTESQAMRHLTTPAGDALDGFRLVLLHHPLDHLHDGAAARRRLAEHADLLLRGHLHEPEVETWADPDRKLRQLAAGCLYEGHRADQYPNACQAVTLELDGGGRPTRVGVRFRAWSPRGGHWHDDNSLYRESRQGRLTWLWEPRRAPVGENPYHPWDPSASDFVGRVEVLRRLGLAMEETRGVALVGDWRMGKTLLLQVWAERARASGRAVKLLSGEGPEGVSVGAFVREITGLAAPDDPDDAADVLDAWVKMVSRPGLSPVLLVDETDGLVRLFGYRFFERLRGLLGRLSLVLASRQELDHLFEKEGRGSPLTNRLETQWLGLLEPAAADALVARGSDRFAAGSAGMLRQWAGQHPFFVQLFGYYLVEARQLGRGADWALEQFKTQAFPRVRALWNVLAERDREALRAGLAGEPVERLSLRNRGLVSGEGRLFGEVLAAWMREEA